MIDNKTDIKKECIETLNKAHELKDKLSADISKFDDNLNEISIHLNHLISKAEEEGNFALVERLTELRQFYYMWGSLSNGIRCVLSH